MNLANKGSDTLNGSYGPQGFMTTYEPKKIFEKYMT